MSALSYKINKIAIGCILLAALGCQRKMSREDIGDELKKAMQIYLEKSPHFDPGHDTITILTVNYFEDKMDYICEFKVRMKIPSIGLDTVGMMTGKVSKDFSTVYRKN
jgi:hypothetical protein